MMITKKSETTPSAPRFSKNTTSSIFTSWRQPNMNTIWIVYGVILIVLLGLFISSLIKTSKLFVKSKPEPSAYDNKLVVNRFKRCYNIWNTITSDPMFVVLTKTLMEINSSSAVNGFVENGSKEIHTAFMNLDRYVKDNLKFPEDVRITIMYNDGIVFYDSVLKINDVFFMKNGLPRPVNLYTLGSPLKDHNMLPEVANSIVFTDCSDNRLSGMVLTDPFYRKLVNEGYGFIERISSTFNKPFTYMAHNLNLGVDPATGFVNIITVRIGMFIKPSN